MPHLLFCSLFALKQHINNDLIFFFDLHGSTIACNTTAFEPRTFTQISYGKCGSCTPEIFSGNWHCIIDKKGVPRNIMAHSGCG